jgi:succinate dehydrogenase / fumarate reductase cytochrome b subunit
MSASVPLVERLTSTVARELLVAVTGLALVGFILMHLSGNLLIFFGPEVFNDYSAKLHAVPELLWIARIGLLVAFFTHLGMAISLARANRGARERAYDTEVRVGRKSPATRMMLLSGLTIFVFIFLHLYDFTLRDHHGPLTLVGEEELGLYGLVWNSFGQPVRALIYIVAVSCVGLHLSHAISSMLVTLGVLRESATDGAERLAMGLGAAVALGFSSIPLYVLIATHVF